MPGLTVYLLQKNHLLIQEKEKRGAFVSRKELERFNFSNTELLESFQPKMTEISGQAKVRTGKLKRASNYSTHRFTVIHLCRKWNNPS